MSVIIEAEGAERAGETGWIKLVTEVANEVEAIDQVLIWSDQARFHFDAGAYSDREVSQALQEAFDARVNEPAIVSGGSFAYLHDVDGHTNTKEIRARNPF